MDFGEFLRKFKNHMDSDDEWKPIKTIPMKKEWSKDFEELSKASDALQKAQGLHENLHKAFWSKIKLETGEFGQLRLDDVNMEIEVRGDETPRRAVRSPFTKM